MLQLCVSNPHVAGEHRRSVNITMNYNQDMTDITMEQYGCKRIASILLRWKWWNKRLVTTCKETNLPVKTVRIVIIGSDNIKTRWVNKNFLVVLGNSLREGIAKYSDEKLTPADINALSDIIGLIDFDEYGRCKEIVENSYDDTMLEVRILHCDFDKAQCNIRII